MVIYRQVILPCQSNVVKNSSSCCHFHSISQIQPKISYCMTHIRQNKFLVNKINFCTPKKFLVNIINFCCLLEACFQFDTFMILMKLCFISKLFHMNDEVPDVLDYWEPTLKHSVNALRLLHPCTRMTQVEEALVEICLCLIIGVWCQAMVGKRIGCITQNVVPRNLCRKPSLNCRHLPRRGVVEAAWSTEQYIIYPP